MLRELSDDRHGDTEHSDHRVLAAVGAEEAL